MGRYYSFGVLDVVAIFAEAGRVAEPGRLYGVWAAEAPDKVLRMEGWAISGRKPFCSGAGIVDRALVTVKEPAAVLVDVDLRARAGSVKFDDSAWKASAFWETKTSLATFESFVVKKSDVVGEGGYYLDRHGFWHGACGPAACWAGALLDFCIGRWSRSATQTVITNKNYFSLLHAYTRSQDIRLPSGRTIPWIDEDLDPDTGEWIARDILVAKHAVPRNRGRYYNHSGYADLIITAGFNVRDAPRISFVYQPVERLCCSVEHQNVCRVWDQET